MFAKTIIDSDSFIDMPVTARLLYYDLAMRADDDGFVNSPKKIMRMVGASQDDLTILITKKFIIPFESGVVVIKHWRIHNYIRSDRYKPTKYRREMNQIAVKDTGSYTLVNQMDTVGIPSDIPSDIPTVSKMDTQVRLGKDRLGKDSKKSRRFTPPTLDEVQAYCAERHSNVDPKQFYDYFTEGNWIDSAGKPVKNWKQKVISWEKRGTGPKISVPDYIEKQERGEYEEEEHLW